MFPANSEVIDFTKTSGRVRLFDSVLEAANRYALIDLQSNLLNEFFSTYSDIGFDEEAYRQSVHVVVYYVLDKSYRSLERAHEIYEKINHGQFFLVENEAIGKPNLRDVSSPIQHMLSRIRILRFPLLSAGLIDVLEDPGFSLFDFMAGQNQSIEYDCQLELWNLLEFFYQQRAPDKEGITHFL